MPLAVHALLGGSGTCSGYKRASSLGFGRCIDVMSIWSDCGISLYLLWTSFPLLILRTNQVKAKNNFSLKIRVEMRTWLARANDISYVILRFS